MHKDYQMSLVSRMNKDIAIESNPSSSRESDLAWLQSIVSGTFHEWCKNAPCPLRTLIHNMYFLGHVFCSRFGSPEGLYRIDIDESFAHAIADHASGRLSLCVEGGLPLVKPLDLIQWVIAEEIDLPINRVFAWAARDLPNDISDGLRELLAEPKPLPRLDPALSTAVNCWTEDDAFHFKAETGDSVDEALFLLTEREGRLLHLLSVKWPQTVIIGEIMDLSCAGQRNAKTRGMTRSLFSDTRDRLGKAGINTDVLPKLNTCVNDMDPVTLKVLSLNNLDEQKGFS